MEVFVVVLIVLFFFVFPAIGRAVGGATRRRGPHGELIGHGTFRNAYAGIIYVIQQQHVGVIERMGKFHQIVGPGLHVRAPFIDRVIDVSLMTEDEHVTFDAKTADNVTIELDVSIQYHVDYSQRADGTNGIYQSLYTLTDPVSQMRDYFADALRLQIPARTLD